MSNSAKLFTLLSVWLACGVALADPTADQLTRIEAETLLLKARERQLDVQASILAKQNDIAAKQGAGAAAAQNTFDAEPVARGIEGIGKDMIAVLQLSDGSLVDVQAGDALPDGTRIVSVAAGSVVIQKGKKRTRLAVVAPRVSAFNPGLPAPGLSLPLLSPVAKGTGR